ncbi:MAG: hypothetical protein GXC76_16290 [Rhodanobacteraceae bacterium]|jgi:hypothetical protein|nr:hypothetical protein [Rhodanobacteraceae bacterium]
MTDRFLLRLIIALAASVLLFSSSLYSDEAIKYPGELNRDKRIFDGKVVILRGYLIHEPGAYAIWDSLEAMRREDVSGCVSLLYSSELLKIISFANRHYVTVRGIFRRDVTKDGGVFLGLCNYTGIVVSEVIDVQK